MVTVSLMFGLIMRLCTDHVVGDFLRRVFGKLRLQNELHSLCGQQHRGKSFQVTFYFWGRVIFYCNCIVARELWTLFSMFGVQFGMSKSVVELLLTWRNWLCKYGSSFACNLSPLFLSWDIWRRGIIVFLRYWRSQLWHKIFVFEIIVQVIPHFGNQ